MQDGKFLNLALWVHFFIALFIEPLRIYTLSRDEDEYKVFTFIVLLIMVLLFLVTTVYSLFISYQSGLNSFMSHVLYTVVFIITFVLLYVFRKKSDTFLSLLYNVQTKDATGCKNLEAENVTVKTSGETLYPNIAFLSFLILIFIPMISNSKFLNAMNGLFLGLFIGSMSYVGIEFPLRREPGDYCLTKDKAACNKKGIPDITNKELNVNMKTKQIINNLTNKVSINTWTTMGVALIVMIVIIIISLRIVNE